MDLELTALALVAIAVKLLIDVVRRSWKTLDATGVNAIAFALGYGATFVPEVGDFSSWVGRANAAIGIAGLSSIVAELTKMMRAKQLEALTVSDAAPRIDS